MWIIGASYNPFPPNNITIENDKEEPHHGSLIPIHENPTKRSNFTLYFRYREAIVNPIIMETITKIKLNKPLRKSISSKAMYKIGT